MRDAAVSEYRHRCALSRSEKINDHRGTVVANIAIRRRNAGVRCSNPRSCRCQPRDLLAQIANYCVFNGTPIQLSPQLIDRVAKSYFTVVSG